MQPGVIMMASCSTPRWVLSCHKVARGTPRRPSQFRLSRVQHSLPDLRRHRSNVGKSTMLSKTTLHIGHHGIEPEPMEPQGSRDILKAYQFFKKCEFMYSAAEIRQHPINEQEVPEILVLGASNVGKSSLLNSLFNRKDMARASKEPGKTTLMNAYGVGQSPSQTTTTAKDSYKAPKHGLILMDTPGYGFGSRSEWGQNILTYIEKRKAFRGAMLLLSAEKKLNEEDRWILEQLASASTRVIVVLTRVDKVRGKLEENCSKMALNVRETAESLERTLCLRFPVELYAVSAHSAGDGTQGGIGGLRPAILDMAGIAVGETKVEQTKESIKYTGKVVSFDDIQWKA